jgi:pre-mRNA-splicing factor CDC5/CEF1
VIGKDVEELTGMNRQKQEREARKKDKQRQKLREKDAAPEAILAINKLNDPNAMRRRATMVL